MKKCIKRIALYFAVICAGNLISQTVDCKSLFLKVDTSTKYGYWAQKTSRYTGDCVQYYSNGKKEGEFHYENGHLSGIAKWYFTNGQLKMECTYIFDSHFGPMASGPIAEYFENGKIKRKVNYKDGVQDGKWFENDSNGKILKSGEYKNGKLVSGDSYSPPLK
ncbi:MAG: hypothetical protein IAF38_03965 [Bacteroidia bacterium]|nr:hypothetical protein [Bacteroidia bacterium]